LSGAVRVRLFQGTAVPVGRQSPNSLYREDFATFGADEVYRQADAEGFIRLFGLPERIRHITGASPNPSPSDSDRASGTGA